MCVAPSHKCEKNIQKYNLMQLQIYAKLSKKYKLETVQLLA